MEEVFAEAHKGQIDITLPRIGPQWQDRCSGHGCENATCAKSPLVGSGLKSILVIRVHCKVERAKSSAEVGDDCSDVGVNI